MMRRARNSLARAGTLLLLSACGSGIEPAPVDEACRQARYAVAAVQFACGVPPKKANGAYDAFSAAYTCVATAARANDFECADGILATPCSEALARPADDVAYLASAAACVRIFQRTDGSLIPLSTVPSKNPACEPLLFPLFDPRKCSLVAAGTSDADGRHPSEALREDTMAARAAGDAAFICIAADAAVDPTPCIASLVCERGSPVSLGALLAPGAPCSALLSSRPGSAL